MSVYCSSRSDLVRQLWVSVEHTISTSLDFKNTYCLVRSQLCHPHTPLKAEYIVSSHCLIEKLPVCFVGWLVAFVWQDPDSTDISGLMWIYQFFVKFLVWVLYRSTRLFYTIAIMYSHLFLRQIPLQHGASDTILTRRNLHLFFVFCDFL